MRRVFSEEQRRACAARMKKLRATPDYEARRLAGVKTKEQITAAAQELLDALRATPSPEERAKMIA